MNDCQPNMESDLHGSYTDAVRNLLPAQVAAIESQQPEAAGESSVMKHARECFLAVRAYEAEAAKAGVELDEKGAVLGYPV